MARTSTDDEGQGRRALSKQGTTHYTEDQKERLQQIHQRLIEARRELDALIGDAYLRPRASIVPVHFLDLASAVEKLRWAEKEWRELDREKAEEARADSAPHDDAAPPADHHDLVVPQAAEAVGAPSAR